MNNRYIRFISMVLCIIIFMTPLVACSSADKEVQDSLTSDQVAEITEMLETFISEESTSSQDDSLVPTTDSTVETILESAESVLEEKPNDSNDNENDSSSFVGDMDVFVYGLLINRVLLNYDCFNATIRLDDGTYMSGIAYTDYDSYFEVIDETSEYTEGYFPAGFVPLMDEPVRFCDLKKDLHGTEIRNTDYEIENNSYFLAYDLKSFTDHCVIWGQYLKYGIDDNGDVFYETYEFDGTNYDKTVGSLYSYDSGEEIYQGPYNGVTNITGESISSQVDFIELNKQINDLLDQQDANFSNVEVNTYFNIAQERVNAFLLSQQEETYFGYSVEELIKYVDELQPNDCIRITPNGIEINALLEEMPEEPSLLVKWLVGINAAVAVIGGFVVPLFIPWLKPACDAVAGASVEIFSQVVIQNRTLKNVDWTKVAIATVSAVAFGYASYLQDVKIVGLLSVAIIGGATSAAYAYCDGKSGKELANAFVVGAAISSAFFVASKVAGNCISKMVSKSDYLFKLSQKTSNFIANHQVGFPIKGSDGEITILETILNPRAKYASIQALKKFEKENFRNGNVKDVKYFDSKGNEISKKEAYSLEEAFISVDKKAQPEVAAALKKLGVGNKLPISNGKIDWQELGVGTFYIKVTNNRDTNFKNTMECLIDTMQKEPDKLDPQLVKDINTYISKNNINITDLNKNHLNDMGYTIHEDIGFVTIVKTDVHDFFGHAGGVYYAKQLQNFYTDFTYFEKLPGFIPECIVGTFVYG